MNGKVSAFVELVADVTIDAVFDFHWDVYSSRKEAAMKLVGKWTATFNAGVQFDASLELSAQLFEWTTSKPQIAWLSEIPIVYEPFVTMELVINTHPLSVSAGVTFELEQSFEIGYELDKHHDDKQDKFITDDRRISNFGDIQKKVTISSNVDSDEDGCPDFLQHFGFDVVPSVKVGAVFYALLSVYARPELTFPVILSLPQSDGPTCGRPANFDMCSVQPLKGSWSISGEFRFYLGYEIQNLDQMVDRMWEQYLHGSDGLKSDEKWNIWQGSGNEWQIGSTVTFDIAQTCFDLPSVLNDVYSRLCCPEGLLSKLLHVYSFGTMRSSRSFTNCFLMRDEYISPCFVSPHSFQSTFSNCKLSCR